MGSFTTTEPCSCCGQCITGTLQCSTRGGLASLCGYVEFAGPSDPPKRYRTKTYSGGWTSAFRENGSCTGNYAACDQDDFSGQKKYDKDTCSITDTSDDHYQSSGCVSPTVASCPSFTIDMHSTCPDNWTPRSGNIFDIVNTRTTSKEVPNGNCGGSLCSVNRIATGSGQSVMTLSDEDLDTDAIARLLAGSDGTWGAWNTVGVTCPNPSCCLARWQIRSGPGAFSFIYQEARWRVTASGLSPGQFYTTNIVIYRRPFGSGAFELYQSFAAGDNADGSGNITISGDIPNDAGFETYADQAPC